MLTHQFREFADRSVWTNPIDSFVHHVFDFHDPPPLLDFAHSVKSNPGSLDASDYTTDRALLGLSAATAAVPPLAGNKV
jgi:hypothetical protein